MGCCGGPRRAKRSNRQPVSVSPEVGDDMVTYTDSVLVEYVGPRTGGFSEPAPSGRRYRFSPPYRRTTQVHRDDAVYFANKAGYRVISKATLGPAVVHTAPVQEPIRVADYLPKPGQDQRKRESAMQAAAMITSTIQETKAARDAVKARGQKPTPPQVIEQILGRQQEATGQLNPPEHPQVNPATDYADRKRRVPRARVDEKKTPRWAPKGL